MLLTQRSMPTSKARQICSQATPFLTGNCGRWLNKRETFGINWERNPSWETLDWMGSTLTLLVTESSSEELGRSSQDTMVAASWRWQGDLLGLLDRGEKGSGGARNWRWKMRKKKGIWWWWWWTGGGPKLHVECKLLGGCLQQVQVHACFWVQLCWDSLTSFSTTISLQS